MDSYHAHALPSRRLYGDIKHEVEKYRPLNMKLSIRFQNVHGHCLTHTIKTTGENPGNSLLLSTNLIIFRCIQI